MVREFGIGRQVIFLVDWAPASLLLYTDRWLGLLFTLNGSTGCWETNLVLSNYAYYNAVFVAYYYSWTGYIQFIPALMNRLDTVIIPVYQYMFFAVDSWLYNQYSWSYTVYFAGLYTVILQFRQFISQVAQFLFCRFIYYYFPSLYMVTYSFFCRLYIFYFAGPYTVILQVIGLYTILQVIQFLYRWYILFFCRFFYVQRRHAKFGYWKEQSIIQFSGPWRTLKSICSLMALWWLNIWGTFTKASRPRLV